MKTITQLKRSLKPGTQLILIHTLLGPTYKIRIVKQVRSQDMILTTEDNKNSYCQFPKANDYIKTEKGFRFMCENEIAAEYIFVDVSL